MITTHGPCRILIIIILLLDTDIELLHASDIKDTEDPGKVTICKDERKYYTTWHSGPLLEVLFRISKEIVKGKYYIRIP